MEKIAQAGGIFAVLAFIHFFSDFIFQSHNEAMKKHNHFWIRAKHCAIYTVCFIPILYCLNMPKAGMFISLNILFWSHFIEDTYIGVFLWAKHIRKPPEIQKIYTHSSNLNPTENDLKNWEMAGFKEFVATPLGKILMIAIDQIIHLSFLWPVVFIAMVRN